MTESMSRRACLSATFFCAAVGFGGPTLSAQVIGEQAELDRLQSRAEEAMANGDPDGAAMNMGKAALLAGELARRKGDVDRAVTYRALEALMRAREHGYRALALFIGAGGQPPASSGVCGSLSQAYHELARAKRQLDSQPTPTFTDGPQLQEAIKHWGVTLDGLTEDFQCP
jgi:hypothetical protein